MIDKVKEVLLAEQELVYINDWEYDAEFGLVVEPHEFLEQVKAATTIEALREITIDCWKENGCEKYQGIRFFTEVLEQALEN